LETIKVKTIDLINAGETELEKISRKGLLSLDQAEMKAVRNYFRRRRRNPTDVELETIAQTWSEHCKHKTLKGIIEYEEYSGRTDTPAKTKIIDNLLKETIVKATKQLKKDWCVSVFDDNAGIMRFDEKYNIAFKVETHNHPSAIEPYGGAGTGIGGVIRDIMGVGLGAKPVLNTDVFCFGPPDYPFAKLPEGVLHPKRVFKGVVAGVRDYGNRMGIPTANGAVLFDEGYICNPLVYCGTVGIIPKDKSFKKVRPGDLVVVIGGRTGRDGIHGATFSSIELDKDTEVSAVQIGNAIMEKKTLDVLLRARDAGLYRAVTDCGAGGFSSAVGELGAECGAEVDLEKAPLKYEGLAPWEIWVSEAQERMVLAVPPKNLPAFKELCSTENVELTVIGTFTNTHKLILRYKGKVVGDMDMKFVHHGVPRLKRKAAWQQPKKIKIGSFPEPSDLTRDLHRMLSSLNIASKEWVIRQYDHEVQGGSILKPLVGAELDGPGDACVLRPRLDSKRGVVVANGINSKYGVIDAYWMAASAIDEAIRNVITVGGLLEKTALLDNFCWGNPNNPEQLAGLVRACQACYDFAMLFGTPFISGKDSLNNEYFDHAANMRRSIPPTLLISAISVIPDVSKAITMDVKQTGNLIYVIGLTSDEMGGSHYFANYNIKCMSVPKVNPVLAKDIMIRVSRAINQGLVISCHDCSEGGIGVAAAEMAFAGDSGMEIMLSRIPFETGYSRRNDILLFSESNTRFLVEVQPRNVRRLEKLMQGIPMGILGEIKKNRDFVVHGVSGQKVVRTTIDQLKESWQRTFKW